jgi:hypothetical protein
MVKVLITAGIVALARVLYLIYEHEIQCKLYDIHTKYFKKRKRKK